ncbi:intraflagellar transport protein 27 [Paragonimus westermani]|uniref:small monomeric GTPase n=1 Tax=Paragonimus westermani TaxID=34504 RepID=A0A5J4NRR4_9TREM|nr:intraflagellar transport protein 27 [Paragonimus westermani]
MFEQSVSAELVLKDILIPDANDTVVDQINMLIVMFDVTDKTSFSYAESTLSKYREGPLDMHLPTVLIGNKTDLEARRIITSDDGERLAKSFSIPFYETSAKEAVGIEAPFHYLAKEYHNLYLKKIEKFQTII